MRLADIWRLGALGQIEPGTVLARMATQLQKLEYILSILHLHIEEDVQIVGRATRRPDVAPELNTAQVYTAETAAGDINLYARTAAGEERLTGLCKVLASDFSKTNDATLETITGFTHDVEGGKTYGFSARLEYDAGAAGGVIHAINGTATATTILWRMSNLEEATSTYVTTSRGAAMGDSDSQLGSVKGSITMDGSIVVNAAGTLTVEFAQRGADATASTVLAGSTFDLYPIAG